MFLNILMIDDHPPIIEGYKAILSYNKSGHTIVAEVAHSCEKAYNTITNTNKTFDLVFIDLTLPIYIEKNINSGEDLIPLIKEYLPNTKIVVLTSHTESFLLYKLLKEHNPNGLLVKNDITSDEFLFAFDAIINGESYYSETVRKQKAEFLNKKNGLDNYNRQIITLLSQGAKTKTIQEHLHLSKSAIDKRKVFIKDFFDIEKGTDEDIIREARKQGLI